PNTLGQPTSQWLAAHASPLTDGHVFGGSDAVSEAVVQQANVIVQSNSASNPPTTLPTTSTTNPPPPPMRLVSAHAGAGSTTLSVTYSQQAVCPSVSDDGSDYIGSIVAGPDQGTALKITGAVCPGAVSQDVSLQLASGSPNFAAGDVVQIQTQKGSNGVAVSDTVGDQDPVGDSVRTTAS
ncbi:MAG TPA: hypothetical protein VGI06_15615, partial [Acidimicrobiales bacterium]